MTDCQISGQIYLILLINVVFCAGKQPAPGECQCQPENKLFCTDMGLTKVPRAVGAINIQLANNSITLTKDSFKGAETAQLM